MRIASLRSLCARRQTLHEHQAWARSYLGLQDLDETRDEQLQQVLAVAALEAASSTPQEMVAIAGAHALLTNAGKGAAKPGQ